MKQRCYNENATGYKYCGGKGAKVCPEWYSDFGQFLKDMGPRPGNAYLQRKNPDGDFNPENCYWDQEKKGMPVKYTITVDGEDYTIREFSEKFNISYHRVYYHLRKGNDVADLLNG